MKLLSQHIQEKFEIQSLKEDFIAAAQNKLFKKIYFNYKQIRLSFITKICKKKCGEKTT